MTSPCQNDPGIQERASADEEAAEKQGGDNP
jgi:hypothetical protein